MSLINIQDIISKTGTILTVGNVDTYRQTTGIKYSISLYSNETNLFNGTSITIPSSDYSKISIFGVALSSTDNINSLVLPTISYQDNLIALSIGFTGTLSDSLPGKILRIKFMSDNIVSINNRAFYSKIGESTEYNYVKHIATEVDKLVSVSSLHLRNYNSSESKVFGEPIYLGLDNPVLNSTYVEGDTKLKLYYLSGGDWLQLPYEDLLVSTAGKYSRVASDYTDLPFSYVSTEGQGKYYVIFKVLESDNYYEFIKAEVESTECLEYSGNVSYFTMDSNSSLSPKRVIIEEVNVQVIVESDIDISDSIVVMVEVQVGIESVTATGESRSSSELTEVLVEITTSYSQEHPTMGSKRSFDRTNHLRLYSRLIVFKEYNLNVTSIVILPKEVKYTVRNRLVTNKSLDIKVLSNSIVTKFRVMSLCMNPVQDVSYSFPVVGKVSKEVITKYQASSIAYLTKLVKYNIYSSTVIGKSTDIKVYGRLCTQLDSTLQVSSNKDFREVLSLLNCS